MRLWGTDSPCGGKYFDVERITSSGSNYQRWNSTGDEAQLDGATSHAVMEVLLYSTAAAKMRISRWDRRHRLDVVRVAWKHSTFVLRSFMTFARDSTRQ